MPRATHYIFHVLLQCVADGPEEAARPWVPDAAFSIAKVAGPVPVRVVLELALGPDHFSWFQIAKVHIEVTRPSFPIDNRNP